MRAIIWRTNARRGERASSSPSQSTTSCRRAANATIVSSKWIADASKIYEREFNPTLTLVYLPHLDYCLQKYGPDRTYITKDLQEMRKVGSTSYSG